MIKINTLYDYKTDWIYPIKQKRQLQDLMIYKKNIVDIRNSVLNKKSCRISYIKKTTKQLKSYDINVKSYYVKRDTKQILVFAVDLSDYRQKTFLLKNILSVIELNKQNTEKQIKIN